MAEINFFLAVVDILIQKGNAGYIVYFILYKTCVSCLTKYSLICKYDKHSTNVII